MIQYDSGSRRFNYRVAGVTTHRGRVLLHRGEPDDFWVLPGGRVEMGESSLTTLSREMREELGEEVEVGRLLWVAENFFEYDDRTCHEIGLYFWMSLPMGSEILERDEPWTADDHGVTLIFRWFPLAALKDLTVKPTFLKVGLARLPETPVHIIHRGV